MLVAIVVGAIVGGAVLGLAGLYRARNTAGGQKAVIVTMLTVLGCAIGAGLASHIALLN